MSAKETPASSSEPKVEGVAVENGVRVAEQSSIDSLSQRGYGTKEKEVFTLSFYESLYLVDKQMLTVKNKKGADIDFQSLLQAYQKVDETAWAHYLIYRDLRSRGYVVREGFGAGGGRGWFFPGCVQTRACLRECRPRSQSSTPPRATTRPAASSAAD